MNLKINSKGFTLIELVMVIVILGILATAVVPKFSDFTDQAHSAAVDGVVGGVRSGIGIFQATALISPASVGGGASNITATTNFPIALDNEASTTGNLFNYVLSVPITEDWSKDAGVQTGGSTKRYNYTSQTPDTSFEYSNTLGTIVPVP